MTREFQHYPGCRHRDPDNCSACALTATRQDAPNYSSWPNTYIENKRAIPAKWRDAFKAELKNENTAYVENIISNIEKYIISNIEKYGVRFDDGYGLWTGPMRYFKLLKQMHIPTTSFI